MLHLIGRKPGRVFIASIILWVMAVITLPATWLHHHSSHDCAAKGAAWDRLVDTPVWNSSVASGDHACTFCTHSWPSFFAGDVVPDLPGLSFTVLPTSSPTPFAAQGVVVFVDGRGPPSMT